MSGSGSKLVTPWPNRLVILLLVLCAVYGIYRAIQLALVNDEVGMLDCARHTSYLHLILGDESWHGWDSQRQFLAAILAKPCIELLPLNEIPTSRLPGLLGLALFLWGVWRIGREFPTGASRVLITLGLLSNAFLLDFFGVARGYGLAVGFTVLSLSFLLQASMASAPGEALARRRAIASVWLAVGAALSNMGFLYFYLALLPAVLWVGWSSRFRVHACVSILLLGIFYIGRVRVIRAADELYFGGTTGFVHDTIGSIVRASFYDWAVPDRVVQLISGMLVLVALSLAYWSYRRRIRAAFGLSMLGMVVAALSIAARMLGDVRYPIERTALYLVPVIILTIGAVAAWSRPRWVRLVLWGVLLAWSGVGLQGANLSHTLTWRECADIPAALLALRDVHQQSGRDVMLAISGSKWTVWYYAEHLLGLRPDPSRGDLPHLRTYGWLTAYQWRILRGYYGLPPDNPLIPGTTHVLLNLLDPDDARLETMPAVGGLKPLGFYPASNTRLEALTNPRYEGSITHPDGRRYVGEFRRGVANGQGTALLPDGEKYVGEFKDAKFHGRGSYTWPDGRKYVGEFRDGALTGQGTATWPDGGTYVGGFRDGQPDGLGKMIYADGRVEDGLWNRGRFVGKPPP
jgi:hypothetical protein